MRPMLLRRPALLLTGVVLVPLLTFLLWPLHSRKYRITVDAAQMGGIPCIRGMRVPVATVVGMVADGMSVEEILGALPDLEAEDISQALRYAAEAVQERELPLRPSA